MKVRDLIAELEKLDPELPVAVLDKVDYEDVGWVNVRKVMIDQAWPYSSNNIHSMPGSATEYVDRETMEAGRKYGPEPERYGPMTTIVKLSPGEG